MSIRKTAREEKAEKTRQHLLDTAQALFMQYGFESVTVEDICLEAGVGKSTFYSIVRSKEEMLMLFAAEERNRYLQAHYTYDESVPFRELFRQYLLANFAYNHLASREWNRSTYISYIRIFRHKLIPGDFYQDEMRRLIARGLRENAFHHPLTADEQYQLFHDWIIGFFIGWSMQPDERKNIDAQYYHILDAMVDSLVK